MQWDVIRSGCDADKLVITQDQGDNSPTIINFPYDLTGATFEGTVNFPTPISLAIDSGITIEETVTCTGSITNNVLTITEAALGSLYIMMPIVGVGVAPGTFLTEFGTGTGGVGTYIVNQNQNVRSTIIAASQVSMQLTSEQTQDVPEGQYRFDLWTVGPDSDPINTDPLTGFFVINESITRIS